ncbi:MAG TPA: phosphodiesterase [Steroidobacteraceae bacterium]|nr:phosphodiesterase [Steroidobacteraceae bacterium]
MSSEPRLLQLSDSHLFGPAEGALRGVVTRRSLETVLRHARAHHWNAEAILLTGDLVNDDPGGYAAVRDLLGPLGKPVWCLPGNHDDVAIMRAELDQPPFAVGGHHDLGAWRIVMLDSCVPGKPYGELSGVELGRLEAALASAGDRQVLIGLHHHPVPMGSRWIDSVALKNPEDFFALTDRYAQVRAVLWGHVHQSHDSRRKGVRLLGTPSTCAQFLPHSDYFAIDSAPPAYRRLTLRADGTIDTEVLRVAREEKLESVQRAAGG